MKFAKRITIVLLACLFTWPCFARRIKLEKCIKRIRSVSEIPITVDIYENTQSLQFMFSQRLGTIQVSVTNETGAVVYTGVIETSPTRGFMISLADEAPGYYQLSIVQDDNSEYVSEFELY